MSQENAVVEQMQETVTAYMRAECPYHAAQSAIDARLQDLVEAIAEQVSRDDSDMSVLDTLEEQSRRRRLVYVELMVGAERQARIDGRSLSITEIEKLLRLMSWMCDTANALGHCRPLPAPSEAEAA